MGSDGGDVTASTPRKTSGRRAAAAEATVPFIEIPPTSGRDDGDKPKATSINSSAAAATVLASTDGTTTWIVSTSCSAGGHVAATHGTPTAESSTHSTPPDPIASTCTAAANHG